MKSDEPFTSFTSRAAATTAWGAFAAAALLAGQACHTLRRRDLPSVVGSDASGVEHAPFGTDRVLRLAAAGDSTLTGPGLADNGDIWVRQVARRLAVSEGAHIHLTSYAVGGSRVRDVLHDQLEPLLAASPDLVVVAVGTNDAIHFTPLDSVERDFQVLVGRLVAVVPAVVVGGGGDLGGISRVPYPLSGALGARGRRVNRVIRAVAAAHHARYIDVSTVDRAFRHGGDRVFAADRFHPNAHGHALWANAASPIVAHAARSISRR